MNFSQKDNETFYQYWERFKDLLSACPHHGYKTWHIISFFYESLTPKMHQFVEMMCNGEFLNKGCHWTNPKPHRFEFPWMRSQVCGSWGGS